MPAEETHNKNNSCRWPGARSFSLMERAVIFANGRMTSTPPFLHELQPADLIIAVDGGSRHCQALAITPSVIIGDLDSLDPGQLALYEKMGVEIIRHPPRKDETDLELALGYAVQLHINEVYILAALGERWDMTLANILLIAQPRFARQDLRILDGHQQFILLRGKQQVHVRGLPGDPLSLIPLAGDCHGVTANGLEYPLDNETLYFGSPRGVSNVFVQETAQININEGTLLCIVNWVGNPKTNTAG
jgi:thiamine pyrophosphokinase